MKIVSALPLFDNLTLTVAEFVPSILPTTILFTLKTLPESAAFVKTSVPVVTSAALTDFAVIVDTVAKLGADIYSPYPNIADAMNGLIKLLLRWAPDAFLP